MYNLNQSVMIKKHLLGGALLVSVLVLLTGCKEMMSSLDNPVSAYFEVTPTQATIVKNQTCQIKYSTISDGKVTFKSSAENIATVDANGLVTAKTAGTAIITVELAATPYYQGATKNVEISVDAVLSIDATEVTVGYGASINLVKDYHLARKGEATINYEIIEGGDFITLDETTKDITGKACGNAKVKVSVPASTTASSDELVIDVKARVQNLAQLVAVIGSGDEPFAYLADDVAITLPAADFDLSGKKVTIKGDDKKPATFTMGANGIIINNNFKIENVKINGSALTTPFIKMATLPTTGLNEKGAFEIDYVAFENVETTGIPLQFFYANKQKYLIKSFTVENCQFAMANGNSSNVNTIFDFNGGGNTALLQINNSTIWCNPARVKAGDFFNSQSGQGAIELGSEKQVRSITNSTMYNISYGQNTCSVRRNDVSGMSYVVKNCIIVNCGKSGQFLVGLNGGSSKGDSKVKWEVAGSLFNSGGSDKSADEATKVGNDKGGNAIVTDYLTGTVSFQDAAAGDFTQSGYNAGDPRWIKK